MRKIILAICLSFMLMFAGNAVAWMDTDVNIDIEESIIADGHVHIQANGPGKDTIVGGDLDNSVDKSKTFNIDKSKTDNSKAQANGPGDDVAVNGDVTTLTSAFGTSIVGSKIAGGDMITGNHGGHINSPHSNHINSHNDNRKNYKNHSGNSHNKGIIEQSKNNSGIIVNQQNHGGHNKGNTRGGSGEDVGGQGGGGNNNIVNASIDNSTCIVEDKREFLAQPMVTFASLGEYKEGRNMGANFQTVEMLTMFKKVFQYDAAFEDYGKQYGEGKCKTIGHSYNGRHEDDPSKEIKVFTLGDKVDPSTIETIGFGTVVAVKKGITSFMVLQKAVLTASLMQGDAIIVTNQGAETVTKSSGWGIGFNTSGGLIAEDGNRGKSAVGSGGTGYSNGKASLLTRPWMTIQVLKFK